MLKTAVTSSLEIAFLEYGSRSGWPVILAHGFPYDVHAYDEVAPILAEHGAWVIVPYMRGYGPTRFLSPSTLRSGQQAALGSDLIELLDALGINKAILAGFDWGGLAACVGAALWPERVDGLVSYAGYDIIDRSEQQQPFDASLECVMWYQHLFQHARGRECLLTQRKRLCRILWQQWSPTWTFSEALYDEVASSFNNPDFVDVVIHSYRHAFGAVDGDPALQGLEDRLAQKPKIVVPSITLDGTQDPLKPGGSAEHSKMFVGRHVRRAFNVGHAFPFEAPAAFVDAITTVHQWNLEREFGSTTSKSGTGL